VVEADIKGFFDHLDQEWLLKMLKERIEDRWLLGLIKKWLKAGVLEEDGQVIHPATGTPQGGGFHELMEQLKRKLRGYYNYYGIKDNSRGLKQFYTLAMKSLFKWLNRRSQRISFSWADFSAQLKLFRIPLPRIAESRQMRLAAS
jgi:retron-type reverse transcriptase